MRDKTNRMECVIRQLKRGSRILLNGYKRFKNIFLTKAPQKLSRR